MRINLLFLLAFVAVVFLMMGGQTMAIPVFAGLAVFCLMGRQETFLCLMLSSILVMLNKDLFPVSGALTTMLRWLVLLLAALSLHIRFFYGQGGRAKMIFPTLLLYGFLMVALVLGNVYGYAPAVSNFKLFIFSFAGLALFQAAIQVENRAFVKKYVFNIYAGVLLVSLLIVLLFPGQAYKYRFSNGGAAYFKGITSQSQTLGVMLSVGSGWLISVMLQDKKNRHWQSYLVFLVGVGMLIATKARTGVAALGLSVIFTCLIGMFNRNWRRELARYISPGALLFTIVVVGLGLFYFRGALEEEVLSFLLKGGRNGADLAESFEASRGFRIKELYYSFLENPWTGNGFGLETHPEDLIVAYDPVFNTIPMKAQVEKNFLPMAVFQETGIVGGSLFVLFVITSCRFLIKYRGGAALFLFLTCIFVNVGEAIFFSLGGMGLFVYVLMMTSFMPATEPPQSKTAYARN